MDREAVAKAAGVIPAAKQARFLEYLVRFPERSSLLDGPHPSEERLQGDLFRDLPFPLVLDSGDVKVAQFMAVVLNNTCDLQVGRSQFVNIAPAFDYVDFQKSIVAQRGATSAEGYLSSVRGNKVAEVFFVAECPGFSDGIIILFDRIATVGISIYEQALKKNARVASFTQNGFFVFLLKITNHLARAETPDVDRVDPPFPK